MNKDSFVEKKVAELMKKECEVRWKEGHMPIVCGAPFPCSIHTTSAERKNFLTTTLSEAIEEGARRERERINQVLEVYEHASQYGTVSIKALKETLTP